MIIQPIEWEHTVIIKKGNMIYLISQITQLFYFQI